MTRLPKTHEPDHPAATVPTAKGIPLGDLRVTATRLRETAARQRDVAGGIDAVEAVTDGVTGAVGRTHGLVCSLSIAALGEAQLSRTAATKAMSLVSNDLAEKLDTAAADYTRTDQQQQDELASQVHPR
ncbi:ESX-1 secretion-associated protein [Mycolicibacterium goodii]|uniref:ESX-1 secretion-associated protein n=1 Tax=Mycolicibacterium goodii TaxID=134601 RepID=UPI0009F9CEA0